MRPYANTAEKKKNRPAVIVWRRTSMLTKPNACAIIPADESARKNVVRTTYCSSASFETRFARVHVVASRRRFDAAAYLARV